ncbi:3,9-dihydroxypterocarpan 6A-monooxygenase-like [Zingiber officinale]|nr:3,9-dihydroxypterocarpan 6A-monooxygenase-like [Zingiber officinale]XP_042396437.1 3,9-dihydroxypterocarpan 6A-monooxygenase-like [Zingiber officinale]
MAAADLQSLAIPILVIVFPILILITWRRRRPALRLPPGPIALPIIGHLHHLRPIPHQSFHKLSKRYGGLIGLRLGSVPCIVVSSSSMIKEIMRTQETAWSDRPQFRVSSYIAYDCSGFVFAPYGPHWRFLKKLCMSELLGGRTIDQLLPIRTEEVVSLVRSLYDRCKVGRTSINMGSEVLNLTNNVISRMTTGHRCCGSDGEAMEMRKIVEGVAELVGKFNMADFIGICKNWDLQGFDKRSKDVRQRYDAMMERIMKEKEEARKKKSGGIKDLLDILIDIADDSSAEVRLSREHIKAFVMDIFVAGTDTSALTLEWGLAELINHPDILRKAQDEIEAVVGKKRLVQESDVANLPYMQAIIKETMRLHPSGPLIPRRSTRDTKIKGYDVPANTTVFVNVWANGRDPEQWPEPFEFRPERFLEEPGQKLDVRGQHFELIPFGSGRRLCPGASLALHFVPCALAAMLQCFDWESEDGGKVDMAEGLSVTLVRNKHLVCVPVPRLNPMLLD